MNPTDNPFRTENNKLEIFNQRERMWFFIGALSFFVFAYSNDLKKLYLTRNI